MWQTLFGLIAVTGMRVNEALSLEQQDVDLDRAVLTLRNTKNGKDRQLPVKGDTAHRLAHYTELRDRLVPRQSPRFFIKEDGEPAGDCGARYNFAQVSRNIGLWSSQAFNRHGHGSRIHDLRHTFAVHTILDWFRDGRDIEAEMYKLSTYLGHSEPKHTFWYIEAVPELMQLAAARAEQRILEVSS
ncbi:tyrosine-type recombinase/integrase [Epibacterium ulvae]|uniref:tyrosine-type recombinase/integrase n=1 Tax=Epibacterium ulvae TaxID=1156985 RepID=UPI001BFC8B4D|nr:tyrosine-type recombinase/integrase [Epibacterium ulvae]MBT8152379.1 tyrosine-type recombinase/integrase [Epibacterium ulvae]